MKLDEYLNNDELYINFSFAVMNMYTSEVKCLFITEEDAKDYLSYQNSINAYDLCCVSADRILK